MSSLINSLVDNIAKPHIVTRSLLSGGSKQYAVIPVHQLILMCYLSKGIDIIHDEDDLFTLKFLPKEQHGALHTYFLDWIPNEVKDDYHLPDLWTLRVQLNEGVACFLRAMYIYRIRNGPDVFRTVSANCNLFDFVKAREIAELDIVTSVIITPGLYQFEIKSYKDRDDFVRQTGLKIDSYYTATNLANVFKIKMLCNSDRMFQWIMEKHAVIKGDK